MLNFAVFRDEPKEDWDSSSEDVIKVDLGPGRLTPTEDVGPWINVLLGFNPADSTSIDDHPVTKVLRAASERRFIVREVQLPVPPPATAYQGLSWARVQFSLRPAELSQIVTFLDDLHQLAGTAVELAPASGSAELPRVPPLVLVQARPDGVLRILNSDAYLDGWADNGPAEATWLRASNLDIVAALAAAEPAESSRPELAGDGDLR